MLPTLRFGPVVPSRGFRWVYKNDENVIELRDPPADWPAADYECLSFDWDEDEDIITGFFNFSKWMEYDHGEETVKDFIQYLYEIKDELPESQLN